MNRSLAVTYPAPCDLRREGCSAAHSTSSLSRARRAGPRLPASPAGREPRGQCGAPRDVPAGGECHPPSRGAHLCSRKGETVCPRRAQRSLLRTSFSGMRDVAVAGYRRPRTLTARSPCRSEGPGAARAGSQVPGLVLTASGRLGPPRVGSGLVTRTHRLLGRRAGGGLPLARVTLSTELGPSAPESPCPAPAAPAAAAPSPPLCGQRRLCLTLPCPSPVPSLLALARAASSAFRPLPRCLCPLNQHKCCFLLDTCLSPSAGQNVTCKRTAGDSQRAPGKGQRLL